MIALQPVPERACAGGRPVRRRAIDEHVVAVDLDREAAQLVRELVEGAAGSEVEAGVVPVAGEDPVADRAAVQREPHVRAAVVDGVHLVALGEEADRVPVEVDDEPPGCSSSSSDAARMSVRSADGHGGEL